MRYRGDARDGDGGSVSGKYAVSRAYRVELPVYLLLDLPFFRHILDHEIRVGERRVIVSIGDALKDGIDALLARAFIEEPREAHILGDFIACMFQDFVRNIQENHLITGLGQVLCDTHAHHTASHHTYDAYIQLQTSFQ